MQEKPRDVPKQVANVSRPAVRHQVMEASNDWGQRPSGDWNASIAKTALSALANSAQTATGYYVTSSAAPSAVSYTAASVR